MFCVDEDPALFNKLYRHLDPAISPNIEQMLDNAITATRISTTEKERKQFYDKHIRNRVGGAE